MPDSRVLDKSSRFAIRQREFVPQNSVTRSTSANTLWLSAFGSVARSHVASSLSVIRNLTHCGSVPAHASQHQIFQANLASTLHLPVSKPYSRPQTDLHQLLELQNIIPRALPTTTLTSSPSLRFLASATLPDWSGLHRSWIISSFIRRDRRNQTPLPCTASSSRRQKPHRVARHDECCLRAS